ncbi:hypothetical protein KRMM14A1259_50470 [Krasilnikovia sp. MM14-A1259]
MRDWTATCTGSGTAGTAGWQRLSPHSLRHARPSSARSAACASTSAGSVIPTATRAVHGFSCNPGGTVQVLADQGKPAPMTYLDQTGRDAGQGTGPGRLRATMTDV